jgi:uncharacterized membrane protein
MRIADEIDITAPVDRVWDLTLDIESWPAITPTMRAVQRLDSGPLRPSSTARVKQPGQREKVWTVTTVDSNAHRFEWRARVFGTDMTASHVLTPNDRGTTNTLTIDIAGRGAGLVGRLVGGQIRKALVTENQSFKRAAEA